jgi:hypothetical protein
LVVEEYDQKHPHTRNTHYQRQPRNTEKELETAKVPKAPRPIVESAKAGETNADFIDREVKKKITIADIKLQKDIVTLKSKLGEKILKAINDEDTEKSQRLSADMIMNVKNMKACHKDVIAEIEARGEDEKAQKDDLYYGLIYNLTATDDEKESARYIHSMRVLRSGCLGVYHPKFFLEKAFQQKELAHIQTMKKWLLTEKVRLDHVPGSLCYTCDRCFILLRAENPVKFVLCTRCLGNVYCSSACMSKHAKQHSTSCKIHNAWRVDFNRNFVSRAAERAYAQVCIKNNEIDRATKAISHMRKAFAENTSLEQMRIDMQNVLAQKWTNVPKRVGSIDNEEAKKENLAHFLKKAEAADLNSLDMEDIEKAWNQAKEEAKEAELKRASAIAVTNGLQELFLTYSRALDALDRASGASPSLPATSNPSASPPLPSTPNAEKMAEDAEVREKMADDAEVRAKQFQEAKDAKDAVFEKSLSTAPTAPYVPDRSNDPDAEIIIS